LVNWTQVNVHVKTGQSAEFIYIYFAAAGCMCSVQYGVCLAGLKPEKGFAVVFVPCGHRSVLVSCFTCSQLSESWSWDAEAFIL